VDEESYARWSVNDSRIGFLGSFLLLASFTFFVFPFGALALIGGRVEYGSWQAALATYLLSGVAGLAAIVGIVPLLGTWMHWWLGQHQLMPWAASLGAHQTWLTETLLASGSVLAAITWAALGFRLTADRQKNRRASGVLADLQPVGLPSIDVISRHGNRPAFSFWVNTLTAILGLGLVVWLYQSWPAYVVVAAFVLFCLFGILRKESPR
jgi:hypothetical protein